MFAPYVNLYGPKEWPVWPVHMSASDESYAALREAVLPAQPKEPWATNDRAKGATRGGRRVVVVAGNAQQYALQDVVW